MRTIARRFRFFVLCSLVLVSLLNPGLPAVRADIGVQPVLPGGGNIQPETQTPVQMAREVVTMTVRPATAADNAVVSLAERTYALQSGEVWFPGVAEVEADFWMLNPTAADINLTAWFPLASTLPTADWNFNPGEIVPRIQQFQVSADGSPLQVSIQEMPNPQGSDKPALPWAGFPLTFRAGVETLVHVSYTLPLQPAPKGGSMALYYIFQTGSGWAGSIGQADLIINLPYPASEGTLSGMTNGLSLPPLSIQRQAADLPAGAVLEGSQVRWSWRNFEPGPQDDIAIWLLRIDAWQTLETARAAEQANPADGQAWLNLASTYYSLSTGGYNMPGMFSQSYIPPGLQAYQKAAELLPERAAPHAGLGLLMLAPYMVEKNAPAGLLQSVQAELQTAQALEAAHPAIQDEAGISRYLLLWLEDAVENYGYNPATATAEMAALGTQWAAQTAQAAPTATPMPTVTLPPTATPPLATQLPTANPTPTPPASTSGLPFTFYLLILGGVLLALIVAVWRVRKGRA